MSIHGILFLMLVSVRAIYIEETANFIKNVVINQNIKTILIHSENGRNDFLGNAVSSLGRKPVVIFTKRNVCIDRFNTFTLSIILFESEAFARAAARNRKFGLKLLKTVFVNLSKEPQNIDTIELLKSFLNSVYISRKNHTIVIQTVFPYQHIEGPRVAYINPWDNPFPNKLRNIVNYELKTYLALSDIPRYFLYKDKFTGEESHGGLSAEIFYSFVDHFHLTLKVVDGDVLEQNCALHQSLEKIKSVDIELFPYLNLFLTNKDHNFTASFPLKFVDYCLMVPVQRDIPKYFYITQPFKTVTWIAVVLSTLYIGLILIIISKILGRQTHEYSHPLLQALSLTMNYPSRSLYQPTPPLIFCYLLLFSYGFIISNLYNAWMSSLLVAHVKSPQINTIQDVLDKNLKVMISPAAMEFMKDVPELKLLSNNLEVQHFDVVNDHMLKYNTSFGYVVPDDTWEFLDHPQQYYNNRKFRLTDICFTYSFGVLIFRKGSPLIEAMNNHFMYLYDFGMYEYFDGVTVSKAIAGQLFSPKFALDPKFHPLSLYYLKLIFIFWCVLSMINGIVFLSECFLKIILK